MTKGQRIARGMVPIDQLSVVHLSSIKPGSVLLNATDNQAAPRYTAGVGSETWALELAPAAVGGFVLRDFAGGELPWLNVEGASFVVDTDSRVNLRKGDAPRGSIALVESRAGLVAVCNHATVLVLMNGEVMSDFQYRKTAFFSRWRLIVQGQDGDVAEIYAHDSFQEGD